MYSVIWFLLFFIYIYCDVLVWRPFECTHNYRQKRRIRPYDCHEYNLGVTTLDSTEAIFQLKSYQMRLEFSLLHAYGVHWKCMCELKQLQLQKYSSIF